MNDSTTRVLGRPQCSDQTATDSGNPNITASTGSTVAMATGVGGVRQLNRRPFPKMEDTSGNNSDKGGNNSDGTSNSRNSAIAGLSTSDYFGFNFEEDQNMLNGEGGGRAHTTDNGESDGDRGVPRDSHNKRSMVAQRKNTGIGHLTGGVTDVTSSNGPHDVIMKAEDQSHDVSVGTTHNKPSHEAAAAAAVANLQSIANESVQSSFNMGRASEVSSNSDSNKQLKRKAVTVQVQSNGYNPDDESNGFSTFHKAVSRQGVGTTSTSSLAETASVNSEPSYMPSIKSDATPLSIESSPSKGSRKKLNDFKREERNAREKERSYRIAKQINELRNLLSSGGVIVPKGTKSSVLTEAANYIRMLQQHQYRSELDRHQLIQQIQVIGGGALGPQAANAIRHVAAQNGVWSLGSFGGLPPRTALTGPQDQQQQQQQQQMPLSQAGETSNQIQNPQQECEKSLESPMLTKIEEHDYRFIFNSCLVGMAVASMGGSFIDCNLLFTQLSQYTKQEICAMTIFNLTSRTDLQHAFDLVSQMISPPMDASNGSTIPRCVLRGSMKTRVDIGLSITLIKGDDGIAKCFCVTLIQNPSSPFDTSRPIPATADFITSQDQQQHQQQQQHQAQPQMDTDSQRKQDGTMASPAFMTG